MPQVVALAWCGPGWAILPDEMVNHILIVGAGQAAIQAIDTLRRKGFAGQLTLVGEEPWLPYQRPPLSKKFLSGGLEAEKLLLRPQNFYAEHRVQTHLGRRAMEIDRRAQSVRLDDGTTIGYDALLLSTGSTPRHLPVPGANLGGVHLLRNIADVERIRADLASARKLLIIGAGYIGLEVAATARGMDLPVTVLEQTDRVMSRVTAPQLSTFYEAEHTRQGVRVICGTRVSALEGAHGRVHRVVCEDGSAYEADVVLISIGVGPRDDLAQAAGLDCENGIVVDQHCRTSDPNIYAAGDCTSHPSVHYGGRHVRLESVDNAFEQASSAALNVLGTTTPHAKVPWFWSDQYDLKMIIVGLSQGYDEAITRGSPSARSFSVCYLRAGELIAIDTVNAPKDQMAARKLVAAHARPDRGKVADSTISLRDCL
jgi:3-phenylpropionate/trans-cinnamate dioxygenase ferredoxin reductase component